MNGGLGGTVVILTALGLEYTAVREHLGDGLDEREVRGTLFEVGAFTGRRGVWTVAIAEVGAGNAPAGIQLERAVHAFSPQVVLFVGVAGGRKDVKLGDVVAADAVYDYEAGKDTERGYSPRIKTAAPSFRLVQRARAVARQRQWQDQVKRMQQETPPDAFVKPIAAGGKVVTQNRSQTARLLDRYCGDAVAVDMESYGFLHGAYANEGVAALVIRGISDLLEGEDEANDCKWQPIAARHAAAFAFELLDQHGQSLARSQLNAAKITDEPRITDQAGSDIDAATSNIDVVFRRHWGPRGRGVSRNVHAGWYFTGRIRAIRELVVWLTDQSGKDARARIVTGDPGSGKSAVLARLVTLADARCRSSVPPRLLEAAPAGTVPPLGTIDIALHVARKTPEEITAELASATGIPIAEPHEFAEQMLERGGPLVIVVDAVDEAEHAEILARNLLQPLMLDGGSVGIHMLVGTRRRLVDILRVGATILDLDDDAYFDFSDLAEYIRRYLLSDTVPDSPYRSHPLLARRVATAVATRANRSFLVAQLTARSLAEREQVIDTSQAAWQEQFPATVGAAMDGYLARFGSEERRITDLLLPLGWVQGAGLADDELWASLATRLGTDTYRAHDLRWLRDSAVGDLLQATTVEEGEAYQLFHEALAEHLRTKRSDHLADMAYVTTLLERVPRRKGTGSLQWSEADTYTRAHLSTHAARTSQVDALVSEPSFVLAVDLDRLLPALRYVTTDQGHKLAAVVESASHQLRTKPSDERPSYLQLLSRQYGADEFADRIAADNVQMPWSTVWAHWRTATPHRITGRHKTRIYSVATAMLPDGRVIAAAGEDDGTIRIWDAEQDGTIAPPLEGHESAAWAIAIAVLADGRAVAVTGSHDQTVRVWSLDRGLPIGGPLTGHDGTVSAISTHVLPDGRCIAITGSADRTIRLWDLDEGQAIGNPLVGHAGRVIAVAAAVLHDGRHVIVSGSDDRTVRLWEFDGNPIGDALTGHEEPINSIAISTLTDGRCVAATGSDDRTVRLWDLDLRVPIGEPLVGHQDRVRTVATSRLLDGRVIAISGGNDEQLLLWDLDRGSRIGDPLVGHSGTVMSVATARLRDGRHVAVSGGADKTVRTWDLDRRTVGGDPFAGHAGEPLAIAVTSESCRIPAVISGGRDGTICVWGREHGALLRPPITGHESSVLAMATDVLATNQCVLISAGSDATVRMWGLPEGRPLGSPLSGHTSAVFCVATAVLGDGRRVAITGGRDGMLWMWDLDRQVPIGDPIATNRRGGIWTIITAVLHNGRSVAVLGGGHIATLEILDLDAGALMGEMLTEHVGPIWGVAVLTMRDRSFVITGGNDRTINIQDVITGEPQYTIDIDSSIFALALSSRKTVVVATSSGLMALRLHL